MRGVVRICVRAVAPLLVSALVGCAVVDNFSGRAVDFNMQAEQVQEQTMLLNVVRASQRRPMQFTGLQSITGSASIQGNGSLSFPFGPPGHRPPKSLSPDVLGLGGQISGGPSFIVPVLDTQEFYEGILSPISLQIFDYYLAQGFPPEVLFDLFVSKVLITQRTSSGCSEATFYNSVADDVEFDQFQAIVDLLFAAGLSTEHVEATSRFGAPIPEASLQPSADDSAKVAKLIDAYANAANAGLKLSKAPGQDSKFYQLEKTSVNYRFCFRDPGPKSRGLLSSIDPGLICGQKSASAAQGGSRGAGACTPGSSEQGQRAAAASGAAVGPAEPGAISVGGNAGFNLTLGRSALKALDDRLGNAAKANEQGAIYAQNVTAEHLLPGAISFQLQLRSTEGILYYLGEVTRRHLYPEASIESRPRLIQAPTRVPAGAMPESACDGSAENGARKTDLVYLDGSVANGAYYFCENMFVVDKSPANAFISVDYDGGSFGLAQNGERSGRTYQVLELTKQNSSPSTRRRSSCRRPAGS